jgi:DNA helicase-2/ATP-dependent DNA helicase PcrA
MLSWSLARNPGGQARRKPSRFLSGMRPASILDKPEVSRPTKAGRRGKAAMCKLCQQPLASSKERNRGFCTTCPIPYDEELFESLRAWRKVRSEADEVPAYVVFSDATLEALAEVRPQDRHGLQEIKGIGPSKVEKYAAEVLAVLAGNSTSNK